MRDIGTTARTLSGEDRTPPPRLRAWPWIPACAGMTKENQILVWVLNLGSGLIGHSQKMMVAASAMAEKKVVGQRS